MKAQVLANFNEHWLTAIAFILFALIFLGVFYMTYIRNSKSYMEKFASMPLDDQEGDNNEQK